MILKAAWAQRNSRLRMAWNDFQRKADYHYRMTLVNEANNIYLRAVEDLYEPGGYGIDWNTGEIMGKILPIPPSELGL